MRKVILFFSILFITPLFAFAAYTRTPAGVTTSTKFTFDVTNPVSDLSGFSASGNNSWWFVFGRVGQTDPIDGGSNHLSCHGNATGTDPNVTAATLGFATGTQIGGIQFRQFTSSNCSTGASNNGVVEGANSWWSVAPTSSIFAFDEVATSSPTSTSATSSMTTADMVNLEIFFILDGLVAVLAGWLAIKGVKHYFNI